ncbi:hypothetical protein Q427_27495 [Halomonas sp. BC04]|nr:hypothetical protein Q427_27495 [Halomonas sp. BC04]
MVAQLHDAVDATVGLLLDTAQLIELGRVDTSGFSQITSQPNWRPAVIWAL